MRRTHDLTRSYNEKVYIKKITFSLKWKTLLYPKLQYQWAEMEKLSPTALCTQASTCAEQCLQEFVYVWRAVIATFMFARTEMYSPNLFTQVFAFRIKIMSRQTEVGIAEGQLFPLLK